MTDDHIPASGASEEHSDGAVEHSAKLDKRPRIDADKGREPTFVAAQLGTRRISFAALVERVEMEFYQEHGEIYHESPSPALREADTPAKRLRLVLDVANYVLAVESVMLDALERAELVKRAFSNLFGYGPLDGLLSDETITTILIEGENKIAVRHGSGEIVALPTVFDDAEHLRQIVGRLLTDAGAELRDDTPIVETGLLIGERPVRVSIVAPPLSPVLNVEIRAHPVHVRGLDDLVLAGTMSEEAAEMLRSIARSKYGFCVVGEPEAGKTVLVNAMLREVPEAPMLIVERAAELRIPLGAERLTARWKTRDELEVTFGEQIGHALEKKPACIVLDEVRSDEPTSIAPLLEIDNPPRLIWAVRSAPDAKRLQSALGMLARRAGVGQGEKLVHALYERLPYVITVARIPDKDSGEIRLRLFSIAEWQSRVDTEYPDYVLLMQFRDGEARKTENTSARWLS